MRPLHLIMTVLALHTMFSYMQRVIKRDGLLRLITFIIANARLKLTGRQTHTKNEERERKKMYHSTHTES